MAESGVDPLLYHLAAGHASAFAELYARLGTRMYRAALRLVERSADAEDVVQEVFAAVFRSRSTLPQVRDLEAYVFTCLRREAIRINQRRGQDTISLHLIPEASAPAANDGETGGTNARDRRDRLIEAIDKLPWEQREVLAWRLAGELTFAQIGELLSISPNTAASRYRYAVDKLRLLLQESVS